MKISVHGLIAPTTSEPPVPLREEAEGASQPVWTLGKRKFVGNLSLIVQPLN
jgi:hypothetical protein